VGAGDVLTFPQARRVRVVRILALPPRRGPAPEAQACYEDLTPPEAEVPRGPAGSGERPTGRDRRRIDALRDGGGE
jgi:ribosome-associated heat shock protein Hsp15